MARFSRLETLNAIVDTGLVPVFYHGDAQIAKKIVEACAEGGARCIEFTNRGDFAPFVFRELAEQVARSHPRIILGVGSIVDAPTSALYLASGAIRMGLESGLAGTGESLIACHRQGRISALRFSQLSLSLYSDAR